MKHVDLCGSVGGNGNDIAAVYELMAAGDLDPFITEITFEEIHEGLKRLERHEVKGRLVAVFE